MHEESNLSGGNHEKPKTPEQQSRENKKKTITAQTRDET